uniref:WD repeat domain 25 n=1 Tax=Astyanax mexicanus TaxID=7994 RepID=A0A3B1JJU5_ASTMX
MSSKRPQPTPAGVRPYVSKRQKLSTQSADLNTEGSSSSQHTNLHLLSTVSERIRPHLGRKGRTELPKYVQHQLQAHQGPVNTVQWCPVPHLSHLLLSASMDKTFKVSLFEDSVGRCLQTYSGHSGAVRDACWLPCGRRILSGSFDNTAAVTEVETGFKVTCLAFQPSDPSVFLCGGFSAEVKAWDSRSCQLNFMFHLNYAAATLYNIFVLDILQERYTCPSLALHPQEDSFVAQTNGNYIALFSAQRPYRMNKMKRFEGHKVEGYAAQCEFSSDGTILSSGSSTGSAHFYDFQSGRSVLRLHAHEQACMCVSFHPVLSSVVATCDWGGEIKIWN